MIKRGLTYFAAACGMLVALVFGLGIFANVIAGTAALILSVPLYAAVLAISLGGVGLVAWLYTARRS